MCDIPPPYYLRWRVPKHGDPPGHLAAHEVRQVAQQLQRPRPVARLKQALQGSLAGNHLLHTLWQ